MLYFLRTKCEDFGLFYVDTLLRLSLWAKGELNLINPGFNFGFELRKSWRLWNQWIDVKTSAVAFSEDFDDVLNHNFLVFALLVFINQG